MPVRKYPKWYSQLLLQTRPPDWTNKKVTIVSCLAPSQGKRRNLGKEEEKSPEELREKEKTRAREESEKKESWKRERGEGRMGYTARPLPNQ